MHWFSAVEITSQAKVFLRNSEKVDMDILIATKDYSQAERMMNTLSDYFSVRHTDTEWDLKRELENRHYDIVIFDYELPQISGVQYIESLAKAGLIPWAIYVCGREAVASYESRLKSLETSSTQVLPVLEMGVAFLDILKVFVVEAA